MDLLCLHACRTTYLVLRVLHRILPDKLQLDKLQQLISVRDAIEGSRQVFQGLGVANGHESGKRIALAGAVGFTVEEGLDKFWCIRDERFRVLED